MILNPARIIWHFKFWRQFYLPRIDNEAQFRRGRVIAHTPDHPLMMNLLLIPILTLLSLQLFSQTGRAKSFRDNAGAVITIADTTICTSPLTYKFFETNVYGMLIMPEIDVSTMNYEFIITGIRTIKTNKEFDLSIYKKIDPKTDPKVRALGSYGKSVYKVTIKEVDGQIKIDKFVYLYSEI
jgi:hypothetical protein